jgi:hypothetical protein
MIRKTFYILTFFLTIIITEVSAQNSQAMYFMNLPQNHLLNPAFRPSNSVYIGLPVLTGISLNMNNNFVNFSDVFMKGKPQDSIISFLNPDYNIDKFLSKIKDKNFFEPEVMVQLISLGFSVGKDSYFFLDINERIDGNIVIPGDLLKLAFRGNQEFVGNKIDLSSLRGDLKYFREVGAGFSRNFSDRLRIGIKAKLLFGIASVSMVNNSLGITVNDDYSHLFDADLAVNTSGLEVKTDSKNNVSSIVFDDSRLKTASGRYDFFSGSKNMGLGIDIGASYDLTDRIVLSASVIDLGFIRWKKDVTNLKTKNQFLFSGLNMLDVINGTRSVQDLGNDILDSLKNAFVVNNTKSPFTTYLPFGISFGGSYNVTRRFSMGLLSYSRIIQKQVREALTLSVNLSIGNAVAASASYTAENHRYDNLGAGLAFRTGITQFYLIADRIPITWDRIKSDQNSFILPSSWNTINLRIGMNLVFGTRKREVNDKPMIQTE